MLVLLENLEHIDFSSTNISSDPDVLSVYQEAIINEVLNGNLGV